MQRLYKSNKWYKDGESPYKIQKEYSEYFSYISLKGHLERHQFMLESDLKKAQLNKIHSKAVTSHVKEAVTGDSLRSLVMEKGKEGIENGDIPLKAADVIKAAKDQDELTLKRKDQSLAIMDMIYKFQSGEMQAGDLDAGNRSVSEGSTQRRYVASE